MDKIYKLKFTILQQEILRLLFVKAGESFNARGLAKNLEVSQTAILKSFPTLERETLIRVRQDSESKRWSIELNRDNQNAIFLKRAENLKMLYESGLANLLYEKLPGALIILFGSYSYGTDTFDSDIDIAVIGVRAKNIDLKRFESILNRKISLQFYGKISEIHKNLKNNIMNGIVLKGVIEI